MFQDGATEPEVRLRGFLYRQGRAPLCVDVAHVESRSQAPDRHQAAPFSSAMISPANIPISFERHKRHWRSPGG